MGITVVSSLTPSLAGNAASGQLPADSSSNDFATLLTQQLTPATPVATGLAQQTMSLFAPGTKADPLAAKASKEEKLTTPQDAGAMLLAAGLLPATLTQPAPTPVATEFSTADEEKIAGLMEQLNPDSGRGRTLLTSEAASTKPPQTQAPQTGSPAKETADIAADTLSTGHAQNFAAILASSRTGAFQALKSAPTTPPPVAADGLMEETASISADAPPFGNPRNFADILAMGKSRNPAPPLSAGNTQNFAAPPAAGNSQDQTDSLAASNFQAPADALAAGNSQTPADALSTDNARNLTDSLAVDNSRNLADSLAVSHSQNLAAPPATGNPRNLAGSLAEVNPQGLAAPLSASNTQNLAVTLSTDNALAPAVPLAADNSQDFAATLATQTSMAPQAQAHNAGTNATTEIATPLHDSRWAQDFGEKVVWLAKNDQQTAQIHINPPQLGPMQITLTLNGDQASALFVSSHSEVRQAIADAMPQLREMLAGAGISLGQANVGTQLPQQQNGSSPRFSNSSSSADDKAILRADGNQNSMTTLSSVQSGRGMVDLFA